MTGKDAEEVLGQVNITVNKNTIPFDQLKPFIASGIRLGTPALTTRGLKEAEFKEIAKLIDLTFKNRADQKMLLTIKERVIQLVTKYPMYEDN